MSTAAAGKTSLKQSPQFRWACIIASALMILIGCTAPPPAGLERVGWQMLMLAVAAIILFISEAIPMIVICMMIIFTMKYMGVMSFKEIQQNAGSSSVFFIMAGFGLGAALQNTNLAAILLRAIYRSGKGSSAKMVSAALWMSALISVFVSNGTAQVVTMAVVLSIIDAVGIKEAGPAGLPAR